MTHHPYFVFICGAFCSILAYTLFNYLYLYRNYYINYIPEETFLQVKEDFSIYVPYISKLDILDSEISSKTTEVDENEAFNSLKIALAMRKKGNDKKAQRLFQHAFALAPKNPEILVKYGEYLEHARRDILKADELYVKALTVNPRNSEALVNRQRTANIVEVIDRNQLNSLEGKRNALQDLGETNFALRRAKKEAYFQLIYHSVGIEGNTMNLAQTRSILETGFAIDGKSIDEHNEILGLDSAMKYINASLVNENGYISTKDILEIHKRVIGHVDPVEGGELRRTQVYVGGHIPPGPGDLAILMLRFEQWLNSEKALSLHPVKLAALAHYKLVHIHPFIDGNGRTSRVLMNTILMRAGYPPVIIPKQKRHKYYEFLKIANNGDIRPFIRFIADCTEKTLDLYLWATGDLHKVPQLPESQHSNKSIKSIIDEL